MVIKRQSTTAKLCLLNLNILPVEPTIPALATHPRERSTYVYHASVAKTNVISLLLINNLIGAQERYSIRKIHGRVPHISRLAFPFFQILSEANMISAIKSRDHYMIVM